MHNNHSIKEHRGHLIKWYSEDDYEIIHTHTCEVKWFFRYWRYEQTNDTPFVNVYDTFNPVWTYTCYMDFEISNVGVESMSTEWPWNGAGFPPKPGTYELAWWNTGEGDDFESGLFYEVMNNG